MANAFPDSDGLTLLHGIANNGTLAQLEVALATPGCDVNALAADFSTPLHCAVEQEKLSIVRFLLTCQQIALSLNQKNKDDQTPLELAEDLSEKNYAGNPSETLAEIIELLSAKIAELSTVSSVPQMAFGVDRRVRDPDSSNESNTAR